MNATGLPTWLGVAYIVDSEASHSTTGGMASPMGFSDATSSSFLTALNAFSAERILLLSLRIGIYMKILVSI